MLTIHSIRVWLACALLAAGATPEQIVHLLRWSSAAARRLYAQYGAQLQVTLLNSAQDVPLDTVRAHTLLSAAAARPLTADEQAQATAGEALENARRLLERAAEVTGPLPPASSLPVIDDDDVMRRVDEAEDVLAAAAKQADQALGIMTADEAAVHTDDDDED